MNSDRITHRITDLLKLAGVVDERTVEELTDHYLTHIEEEVKRGVNAQKAVRETYQDIAHLDTSHFIEKPSYADRKGLLFFFLIFVSIGFYLFQQYLDPTQDIQAQGQKESIAYVSPPMGSPILQANYHISSEFGIRLNPVIKQKVMHRGIDIQAKIGTPVLATGNGIVKECGFKPKAGNYIIIQHDSNFTTKFYHLSDINVKVKEKIRERQMIGKVGNSGNSIMPHLHYEVLKDEVPVNPRTFIGV